MLPININDLSFTALNQLQSVGYPGYGDNARSKPFSIFDTLTPVSGQNEYTLFTNPNLTWNMRNKLFPASGTEIFYIDKIRLMFNLFHASTGFVVDANDIKALSESYLHIIVNEREKIKLPLWEIVSFVYPNKMTSTVPSATDLLYNYFDNSKKLKYPIIISQRDNVKIKIVLQSGLAADFNQDHRLTLSGTKVDLLNDFEIDQIKNNPYEVLSYNMYDVATVVSGFNSYQMFSTRNKSENLYSKIFDLSDNEIFFIEALEITGFGIDKAGTYALKRLREANIKIIVDDLEYYNGATFEQASIYAQDVISFTFDTGKSLTNYCNVFEKKTKVLETPITIPAKSRVKILVDADLSYDLSNNLLMQLKGTLVRRVA